MNSSSLDAREAREPVERQSKAAVERSAGAAAMEALRDANACAAATRNERVSDLQSTECRSCERLE